jgi:hypothetical protein
MDCSDTRGSNHLQPLMLAERIRTRSKADLCSMDGGYEPPGYYPLLGTTRECQHSNSKPLVALPITCLAEMYVLHACHTEESPEPIVPIIELCSHETEQLTICSYLLNIFLG